MGKIPGVYISQTKRDAEVRNLVYEITSADMWKQFQLQNGRCAYTNWKLSFGYKSETTASLDRIDSSAGYTLENIQWIHKDVNRMKTNFTEERFLQLVKSISLNLGF